MNKYWFTHSLCFKDRLVKELEDMDYAGWELVSHSLVHENSNLVHCIFRKRIPRKQQSSEELHNEQL